MIKATTRTQFYQIASTEENIFRKSTLKPNFKGFFYG